MDSAPAHVAAQRTRQAEATSGGLSIPPPSAAAFGVTGAADAAWLEARLTPHPLRTFTTSQTFRSEAGNGLPAQYILCNDPVYGPLEGARARAHALGWPVTAIATGHDAMVTAPEALGDMPEAGPER